MGSSVHPSRGGGGTARATSDHKENFPNPFPYPGISPRAPLARRDRPAAAEGAGWVARPRPRGPRDRLSILSNLSQCK